MQSIENLLSPVGQAVEHDFAFESKGNGATANRHQKSLSMQDGSETVVNRGRDSQAIDAASISGADDPLRPGSEDVKGYSLDTEMAEYDVDPLPLDVVMGHEASSATKQVTNVSEKGTRSRGIVIEQKSHWQKKDVVTKGQYKPWFFSRFAKSRIPLGKPQCIADLKNITNSCRHLKVKYEANEGNKALHAKNRRSKSAHDDGERTLRMRRDKEDEEDAYDDEDEGESEELWVECENCSKWRKVPPGVEIDSEKSFFCQMLPSVTCETAEEDWDEEETEWVEDTEGKDAGRPGGRKNNTREPPHHPDSHNGSDRANRSKGGGGGHGDGHGGKKRKSSGGEGGKSSVKGGKVRRLAPGSPLSGSSDEPLSPEDITAASSLYGGGGGGGQGMSRLAAVVRVLRATGRAMHYDVLTKQALRLGLIRFTGSQGTAGESMKAFLNKTIRENKTAAVVNLGKGVYGLKEWQAGSDSASSCSPPGPGPSSWPSQAEPLHSELCREAGSLSPAHSHGGKSPKAPVGKVRRDGATSEAEGERLVV